jgi:hypothetical protein
LYIPDSAFKVVTGIGLVEVLVRSSLKLLVATGLKGWLLGVVGGVLEVGVEVGADGVVFRVLVVEGEEFVSGRGRVPQGKASEEERLESSLR